MAEVTPAGLVVLALLADDMPRTVREISYELVGLTIPGARSRVNRLSWYGHVDYAGDIIDGGFASCAYRISAKGRLALERSS